MRGAIALALSLVSATAHAQPASEHEEKHATTAVSLALGTTAAGIGMFALGYHTDRVELLPVGIVTALAGPSLGQWYAGRIVTPGMLVRLGGAGMAFAGLGIAMSTSWGGEPTPDYAGVLAIAGACLMGAGAIYDIATTPKAVERYNQKHGISISPTVSSSGGGPSGFGLSIGGSF